jgi:hypothetical protein
VNIFAYSLGNGKLNELMKASGVQFGTSGVRGIVSDITDEVCFAYVTAFLILLHMILIWSLSWITKGNVLNKNILKLQTVDNLTLVQKYTLPTVMFLLGVVMSWVNTPIVIWNIIFTLLNRLRELITETPEEIKRLRYLLKNNPKMTPEAV